MRLTLHWLIRLFGAATFLMGITLPIWLLMLIVLTRIETLGWRFGWAQESATDGQAPEAKG